MLKRVLTGSALSVVALFANIVVAMALMPFVITHLGDHDYGLWVLVASFVGYYGLLDFGMSTAVTRFISRADGRGDIDEVNTILNTSSVFFAGLGLVVFLLSLVGAWAAESTTTAILWITVGITCIFQFGLRGFYGLYFARIRQDILSYTTLAKLTFRTALIVYFLSIGYGVVAVAVITMLSEILVYLIDMIILRKIVPEMSLRRTFVQFSRVREMINYGKFSMVIQISDLLRLRALPVIVTMSVGVIYVVFFSIAIRLMEIFYQVIEKVIHILTPVFSQAEGRGDTFQIERVFWISFRVNLILSVLIGAGLIIFANPFIAWWIGPDYTLASDLAIWMTVAFLAYTVNQTGKTALFGTSKHQRFAIISAIESACGALVGYVLAVTTDAPITIAIGMAITMIIFELGVKPEVICKEMTISIQRYYTTMLEVMAKMGAPAVAYWLLLHGLLDLSSIINIMISAGVMVLMTIPFMWWCLTAETKSVIRNKILIKLPLVGAKCANI